MDILVVIFLPTKVLIFVKRSDGQRTCKDQILERYLRVKTVYKPFSISATL